MCFWSSNGFCTFPQIKAEKEILLEFLKIVPKAFRLGYICVHSTHPIDYKLGVLHTHWLICRLFVQKNGCNPTLSSKQFYCFGRFRRKKPNVSQSDRVRYLINKYVCYLISTDVAVLFSNYSPDLEHLTLRCCPFNLPQEFGCIYRADYECRMLMLWQFFMMAGDFKKKNTSCPTHGHETLDRCFLKGPVIHLVCLFLYLL